MLDLLPLFLGIVLAQVAPGPNFVAVSASALGISRRAGLTTAVGVASGVFIWAILFTFGMGALVVAFPQLITLMKLLGGGYLFYIGVRSIIGALRPGATQSLDAQNVTRLNAYTRGILVVLTNPKAILMWVAVSAYLTSLGYGFGVSFLIGVGVSLSALVIYACYAWLFSTGIAIRTYRRFFRVVEGLIGAVFGTLGGALLLNGLREIRG